MASKTAIFMLFASVLQRLSIVILTIGGARILGSLEYGRFALAYAFCINVGAVFIDAFGATAGIYLVRQKTEAESARFAAILIWAVGSISALSALGFFAAADLLSRAIGHVDLAGLYRISALFLLFQIPASVISASLYALDRGPVVAVWSCIISMFSVTLGLLGAERFGTVGLIVALAVSAFAACVIYAALLPRSVRAALPAMRWSAVFELPITRFILPSAAGLLLITPVHLACMNMLAFGVDGLHQTAIFSGCFLVCGVFTFIPGALANLVIPHFSRRNSRNDLRRPALRVMGAIAGVGGCMVAVFWITAPWIVQLFGKDFIEGASTMRLLAVVGLMSALIMTTNQLMWTTDRARGNLVGSVGYALVYLTGTFILVTKLGFGANGLAISLLVAQLFQFAVYGVGYAWKS